MQITTAKNTLPPLPTLSVPVPVPAASVPTEVNPTEDNFKPSVVAVEYEGDKTFTYKLGADGQLVSPKEKQTEDGFIRKARTQLWNSLVPENLSVSVTKDYVPSRAWQLGRDFFGSLAGGAASLAVMQAVAPATGSLAALAIGGLSFASCTFGKDRLGDLVGVASTGIARVAEKNPRPWMLAGDVVNNACTVLDASTIMLPPLLYFPALATSALARGVFNTAGGAAGANVAPRQALKGNLGEVSVKNGNQGRFATMAGATVGLSALGALQHYMSFGPAAMTLSAVGALGGLACYYMSVASLDYNPVNERAIRRVLDAPEGEVPGPSNNLLAQMADLGNRRFITAGQPIKPLLQDPKFPALRERYAEKPYIMGIKDNAPYLVMKHDEGKQDQISAPVRADAPDGTKLAQIEAMVQAVHAEKLLASSTFKDMVAKDGQAVAEEWVQTESLKKTPADILAFVDKLKEAGWSTDTVRFYGEERPTLIQDAPAAGR